MKVYLKCFSTLAIPELCDFRNGVSYGLNSGQTIKNLIQLAGINSKDVKIAYVNSRPANLDTVLVEGDQVALASTVAAL